jgi:hypothetical protein
MCKRSWYMALWVVEPVANMTKWVRLSATVLRDSMFHFIPHRSRYKATLLQYNQANVPHPVHHTKPTLYFLHPNLSSLSETTLVTIPFFLRFITYQYLPILSLSRIQHFNSPLLLLSFPPPKLQQIGVHLHVAVAPPLSTKHRPAH